MSSKSGPSAATTSNYSSGSQSQPVALNTYLASSPAIAETLAFPPTAGGRVEGKTEDMKESLGKWQSAWDSMGKPKN